MSNDGKLTYKEFVEKYLPTKPTLDNLSDKTKLMVEEVIDEVKRVSKKVFEEDSGKTPEELIELIHNKYGKHPSVREVVVTADEETNEIKITIIMHK